jgi:hypothetical protein
MLIAVAYVAGYVIVAVRAQLPVRGDVGRDRGVACNAILLLCLFVLDGAVSFNPFPVASLQAVDIFKTKFFEFPCRPGTGRFGGSRSVQDDGFVFGVFFGP